MKAVIVANGHPTDPDADLRRMRQGDLVVAADGGADYCCRLGVTPDVIIGDMDSIERNPAGRPCFGDTEVIRHPARKDATDLELAVRLALEKGARSLVILAALGGRWDMSLGSLFLLALPELADIPVKIIDGNEEIILLKGKARAAFHATPGATLSLLPAGMEAGGITLEGLDYPLVNATLAWGSSRGLSNVFSSTRATVSLERGALLCVLTRKPGNTG